MLKLKSWRAAPTTLTINMTEKSFEKVKKLTRDFFHYCCFGTISGDAYGYGYVHSHPTNHHGPFLDDAMQFLVDDIEMFVFIFPSLSRPTKIKFCHWKSVFCRHSCCRRVQFFAFMRKIPTAAQFSVPNISAIFYFAFSAIDTFSRLNAISEKIRTIQNQHIFSLCWLPTPFSF